MWSILLAHRQTSNDSHRRVSPSPTASQVRTALGEKVSRERVGAEVEGMLTGGHRLDGWIAQLGSGWRGVHGPASYAWHCMALKRRGPAPPRRCHTQHDIPPKTANPPTHPPTHAGPDPIRAAELLHRLRLFHAVFEVHPSAAPDVITEGFGAAGAALLAGAHSLMESWAPQVGGERAGVYVHVFVQ
jgi:hypothetical protein